MQNVRENSYANLGAERFESVWAEGRDMTQDQAIAYALADTSGSQTPPASRCAGQPPAFRIWTSRPPSRNATSSIS
jgi:hypothetical protein